MFDRIAGTSLGLVTILCSVTTVYDILGLSPDVSPQVREVVDRNVSTKRFTKGTIVQRQGDIASHMFFVKQGLLRSYTIDQKGKEHIFMFAPEGWMMSDVESHANDAPAELFIDALEDTEVAMIKRSLLRELELPPDAVLEEVYRLLKRVGVLQRRVIMLMSSPAIERYTHFTETYPQIINRVPQRMIASYLGVTPETLSALRSNLVRGK